MAARLIQALDVPTLAGQPFAPALEPVSAIFRRRFARRAAGPIMVDPSSHRCEQTVKSCRAKASDHQAMMSPAMARQILNESILYPAAVSPALRIRPNDVDVADGPEIAVQPCDLPFEAKPFGVAHDGGEERDRRTQPRQRDAEPMHGFDIAGASRFMLRPDRGNTLLRNCPECRCAICIAWSSRVRRAAGHPVSNLCAIER